MEPKARSNRLEDKLQKLETEIELLESRRIGQPSHPPVISSGQNHEQQAAPSTAPIQYSLPIYPEEYILEASNTGPGIVSLSDYNGGYGSVIPRTIVETSLRRWDTTSEVSAGLKGFLYALVIFNYILDVIF